MEALPGKDYGAGLHETSRAGIIVPPGMNTAVVRIARDQWAERDGEGRIEGVGVLDPVTKEPAIVAANVDEVVRAWLWASADGGNTWEWHGMCGTLGGVKRKRVGGTWLDPIFELGAETRLIVPGLPAGTLVRLLLECTVGVRTKVDVDWLATKPIRVPPRHNSVGFVAANSNRANTASTVSSGNITPTGSDRIVFVNGSYAEFDVGAGAAVTLNWSGSAVDSEQFDQQFITVIRIYQGYTLAPATSAAQGSVTVTGNRDAITVGVLALDGVDQVTPVGSPSTNSSTGTSVTTNVGSMAADDMIVAVTGAHDDDDGANWSQGETERWAEWVDDGDEFLAASATHTGTGTVTVGVNGSAGNGLCIGAQRVIAAAAGGTQIDAGSASLSLSEQGGTVSLHRTIAANADSFAVSELAAAVALNIDIPAGVDTLSLTELAASIAAATQIAAGVDAFTVSELAADVSIATTIDAAVDALTLTELAATLSIPFEISAGVDAFTLTELAAAVSAGTQISAGADSFTVTGLGAVVSFVAEISAGVDALTLTELAASVGAGFDLAAGADSFTLTELAAAVNAGLDIAAGIAAFSITPLDAALLTPLEITAGFAEKTLQTHGAVIQTASGITIQANRVDLTLEAHAWLYDSGFYIDGEAERQIDVAYGRTTLYSDGAGNFYEI